MGEGDPEARAEGADDGIDAQRLVEKMKEIGAADATLEQARTALKIMARKKEARRLARGKYTTGEFSESERVPNAVATVN